MIRDIEALCEDDEVEMMETTTHMIEALQSCAEMMYEQYFSQDIPDSLEEWQRICNVFCVMMTAMERAKYATELFTNNLTQRRSAQARKGMEQ